MNVRRVVALIVVVVFALLFVGAAPFAAMSKEYGVVTALWSVPLMLAGVVSFVFLVVWAINEVVEQ